MCIRDSLGTADSLKVMGLLFLMFAVTEVGGAVLEELLVGLSAAGSAGARSAIRGVVDAAVTREAAVAGNNAARTGFVDGEIFAHSISTGSGNLEMMAQTRVSGSVLHLDDLMIFARTGTQLERVPMGTDAVITLRNGVLAMAREQGFSRVEISYMRYFEGGTVRIPGQLAFDVG